MRRLVRTGQFCFAIRARGFTLIEAVVSIIIIGVLAIATVPVLTGGVRTYVTTNTSLNTLSKMRLATERMAREIRHVRRNPGTPTNYDFTTMTANSLVFVKTDGNTVSINRALPNVTLGYSAPAASSNLTDQVNNLTFRYYTIDGVTATASLALVAFVEIELEMIEDGVVLTQRTQVGLRNI